MLRLALVLCLIAGQAWADTSQKAKQFQHGFADWMQIVGATQGALALRFNGQPVATWAQGMQADDPVELASLSKAITGVCIASLVQDGLITYDTPARDVLDLPAAAPVSIGQLLSHASGLKKDHTQGPMTWWKDDPTPRWGEITPQALALDRLSDDTGYHYSNENYAVLGAVIEAVTGLPYETACQTRVMAPAGISGQGSDRFYAYLPWGGWRMRVGDYAAFVDDAFGPDGRLTDSLPDLPGVTIDGPVSYGMGMVQRQMDQGGRNLWHFGSLCFQDGPNFGSYAVHWQTGWTLTAWYNACLTGEEMFALDAAMVRISYAP